MSAPKEYFHIQLKYQDPEIIGYSSIRTDQEFDLTEEEATEFGKQYSEGCVFFKGKWLQSSFIKEVEIRKSADTAKNNYWNLMSMFQETKNPIVTRRFIKSQPKTMASAMSQKETNILSGKVTSNSKNMFIVHGKDNVSKLELARMLEKMGFIAVILSEQPDKGRTIIEKLEQESMDLGYAFIILTPDDTTIEGKKYARQNVILELGYFVGKLGRKKVCCLYKGDLELPSDIHGVVYKRFQESIDECYRSIIEELRVAGYEIRT